MRYRTLSEVAVAVALAVPLLAAAQPSDTRSVPADKLRLLEEYIAGTLPPPASMPKPAVTPPCPVQDIAYFKIGYEDGAGAILQPFAGYDPNLPLKWERILTYWAAPHFGPALNCAVRTGGIAAGVNWPLVLSSLRSSLQLSANASATIRVEDAKALADAISSRLPAARLAVLGPAERPAGAAATVAGSATQGGASTPGSPSSSIPAGLFGVIIDRPVIGLPTCGSVPVTADSATCIFREGPARILGVEFAQSITVSMSSTEAPDWVQPIRTVIGIRPGFRAYLWADNSVGLVHVEARSDAAEAAAAQRFGMAHSASKGPERGDLTVLWKLQGGTVEYRRWIRSTDTAIGVSKSLRFDLWAYGERWESALARQKQVQEQRDMERERKKRPL
jgi:hypothetical protein